MTTLLFCVFASHFPFFVWRYYKTREHRFAATSLTFLLLSATYGAKLWAPDRLLAGIPLHEWLRIPAAIAAVCSLALLAHHLLRRILQREQRPQR